MDINVFSPSPFIWMYSPFRCRTEFSFIPMKPYLRPFFPVPTWFILIALLIYDYRFPKKKWYDCDAFKIKEVFYTSLGFFMSDPMYFYFRISAGIAVCKSLPIKEVAEGADCTIYSLQEFLKKILQKRSLFTLCEEPLAPRRAIWGVKTSLIGSFVFENESLSRGDAHMIVFLE